ncbi:VOC family protein [Kibdelosporangium phytohabitans]|uniref:Glyoxalase n=1 Tax=Kibdelosporangium phytohabitans TaxID=860235 RepID=A0A0N9IFE6_9PSEU|nr:VOC family protein [Kibdelosporangium phytohabitans]ALG13529.1 glyoxalase [Kibdelosporangium phytohabitans]MBE1465387.1 putative glyoxalase superfamily protein PhnB [Kibdelosporangium phytohabitans]
MTPSRAVSLTPHVFVRDVPAAIEFYRKAFGAVEVFANRMPDGTLLFVDLATGGGRLILSEEIPQLNALSPQTVGDSPVMLLLEVEDVDDLTRRAIFAGATVEMPTQEMFWGERYGIVRDPFGHRWAICSTRDEISLDDVLHSTPDEV